MFRPSCPGVSVSVNTVLNQLEREPDEFIVDPWVVDRMTLVAVQRERVVAAAHLLRYGASGEVGETYRDAGEIRWLLCRPEALPAPGVYGVPEQWPHVRAIYSRAGFVHDGPTEIVMIAQVDGFARCRRSAPRRAEEQADRRGERRPNSRLP